jgi:hypothetical protein
MTTTTRRAGLLWPHAATTNPTSAPATQPAHEPTVLSRHRTSEGVVTYTRCTCGELQIWRTAASRPTPTPIKTTPMTSEMIPIVSRSAWSRLWFVVFS